MKNLHVLTTDKPNFGKYLVINKAGKLCIWNTNTMGSQKTLSTQHIYITSDEEIKEGDWIYYTSAIGYCKTTLGSKGLEQEGIPAKKIILTTDQDLIKDGVQEIDNEFLEWFVKNPSCEEVEVQESWEFLGDDYRHGGEQTLVYKIIIPKEEPKQETLEEVNWKVVYEDSLSMQKCSNAGYESKIAELQEQIERMYSEEEVESLLHKFMQYQKPDWHWWSTHKWFEQFKKKQ
jgi:hypothetical protein